MSLLEQLISQVLPADVLKGAFGSGAKLVCIKPDQQSKGQDQFASNVNFLTVILNVHDKEVKKFVVVKQQPTNKLQRDLFNSKIHFNNEVWMYEHVLPKLYQVNGLVEQVFPDYYYGRSTLDKAPEDDIVVIEDMRPKGYQLTEERLFIDYEHFALAMQHLGRFHALSYRAKYRMPDLFNETVKGLKESLWLTENGDLINEWLRPGIMRGVAPLLEAKQHVDLMKRFAETLSDPFQYMMKLIEPNETMSVICHGDFCRNNMLFKYDATGKPVAVKFFDLQMSRYASPAIDLTFFLFLNTTKSFRKDHWDDLLQVYHNSLSTTFPDVTVPSFDDIRSEVASKAVYGFVHCSYFMPMMVSKEPFDVEKMLTADWGETIAQLGGKEATLLISDMIEDLVQINNFH